MEGVCLGPVLSLLSVFLWAKADVYRCSGLEWKTCLPDNLPISIPFICIYKNAFIFIFFGENGVMVTCLQTFMFT